MFKNLNENVFKTCAKSFRKNHVKFSYITGKT